jgi:hypothetical protein
MLVVEHGASHGHIVPETEQVTISIGGHFEEEFNDYTSSIQFSFDRYDPQQLR